MKIFKLLLIVGTICLAMSCFSKKKISKRDRVIPKSKPIKPKTMDFHYNSDEDLFSILEKAEKADKLVFVDFYASWCLPCQLMDEEVFIKPAVYKFMNKNFINYKIDVQKENGPNLKYLFQAENLPTILFLDQKGRVIERKDGVMMQTELLNMANAALAKG